MSFMNAFKQPLKFLENIRYNFVTFNSLVAHREEEEQMPII